MVSKSKMTQSKRKKEIERIPEYVDRLLLKGYRYKARLTQKRKEKEFEVVTIGRRPDFPERNNARYFVTKNPPKLGHEFERGDYLIEVIWVKERKKK